MEALQPSLAIRKKSLCDGLPLWLPLPPTLQKSTLMAQVDKEGAMVQVNGLSLFFL